MAENVQTDECLENKKFKVNSRATSKEPIKVSRNTSVDRKPPSLKTRGSAGSLNSLDKASRCRSQSSTKQSTPESPKYSADPELTLMQEIHRNLI